MSVTPDAIKSSRIFKTFSELFSLTSEYALMKVTVPYCVTIRRMPAITVSASDALGMGQFSTQENEVKC